jgi:hypothetical protein
MKNVITCKNCNTENPEYLFICKNCSSFIRERVVNIDLWSMSWQIIESPGRAFREIMYAEHKNFVFLIAILTGVKLFFNSAILAEPLFGNYYYFDYAAPALFSAIAFLLIIAVIGALGLKYTGQLVKANTRFKDDFSVIIYSLIPHVFALLILFPIEVVLFGGYLFSANPSPFLLKQNPAYLMAGLEFIFIIYSFVLTFLACKTAVKSIIVSLLFALIVHGGIAAGILLFAKLFG